MMPAPQQYRAGDTIGDYVVLDELGAGGGGQVFRVEHIITRRHEALKVMVGTTQSARAGFLRFLREIRLQAGLTHPNIAGVHNAFWTGEDLVMVMELLEGSALERVLSNRRMPLEDGVAIARQVLCALAYAHEHGVIHRDVSPSNIFVSDRNKVKLTDFGLATMVEDMRVTQNGAFVGSFHYMSPEQVRGNGPLDARTDVYSCGAVLYEILTGRKPFDYDSAFSLMRAQVEQQPLAPVSLNPNLPPELNDIVLRALAKDPAERFPSAAAFRDALDALDPFTLCLAAAGVTEGPDAEVPPADASLRAPERTHDPSIDSRTAAGSRRKPLVTVRQWQYAGGVALATLVLLGAGFASFQWPSAREPQAPPAAATATAVDPVQPLPLVTLPELPPVAIETPPVLLPFVAPAAAAPPARPRVAPRRTLSVQPGKPLPPLPPALIQNASPPEPEPAPVVTAVVAPAAPEAPTPVDPPPPVAEVSTVATSQPVAPEAAAPKVEPRPKGVRGFLGRIRGLNPGRRKAGKDGENADVTSGAKDASKP